MRRRPKRAEELTVGQLLSQVCRMTGHRLKCHMEQIGLHKGQGFALVHLWHDDGIPQHELARAMHLSPASVSNMLQRMERDGWIRRKRDPDDQRVVRVFITEKAKKMRREAGAAFRQVEDEFSAVYTDEERVTLHRLLLKLHDRFAADDAHHSPRFLDELGEEGEPE